MNESVREALEKPFSRQLHRTRRGSHGRALRFVEIAHYIRRLNEATSGDWSFEVIEHKILEGEVVVLCKLTVGSISKSAFGSSAITTARETGKPLSIGDDLKAACADAMKKTASFLGVGLELYTDIEEDPEPVPGREPENVRQLRPTTAPPARQKKGTVVNSSTGTLTPRQASAILKLAADLGMSAPEAKTHILKTKGTPLEKLSPRDASELIGELQARLTGRPGRASAGGAP